MNDRIQHLAIDTFGSESIEPVLGGLDIARVTISPQRQWTHVGDDDVARKATEEVSSELGDLFKSLETYEKPPRAFIILAFLGGFAGSCAARAVSAQLAMRGQPHIVVAALPFQCEAQTRRRCAEVHLRALARTATETLLISGSAIEYQFGRDFTLLHGLRHFYTRVLATLRLAHNAAFDVACTGQSR